VKDRDVVAIRENSPRTYAVVRIRSERCVLVKERGARVGDEYILSAKKRAIVAGPLKPGSLEFADNACRQDPGELQHWEFMEYRVAYAGRVVHIQLPAEVRKRSQRHL